MRFIPHRNLIKLLYLAGMDKNEVKFYCHARFYCDIGDNYDEIYEELLALPGARKMMQKNSGDVSKLYVDESLLDKFKYKQDAHDIMHIAKRIRGFQSRSKNSSRIMHLVECTNERQLLECAIMVRMSPQKLIKAMREFAGNRKKSHYKLTVIAAFSYFFWYYPVSTAKNINNAFDVDEYLLVAKDSGNGYYEPHRFLIYGNEHELKSIFGLLTSDDRRQQIHLLHGRLMAYFINNIGKDMPDWQTTIFVKLLDYIREFEDEDSGPEANRKHIEMFFNRVHLYAKEFPTLDKLKKESYMDDSKDDPPEYDEPYPLKRQDKY